MCSNQQSSECALRERLCVTKLWVTDLNLRLAEGLRVSEFVQIRIISGCGLRVPLVAESDKAQRGIDHTSRWFNRISPVRPEIRKRPDLTPRGADCKRGISFFAFPFFRRDDWIRATEMEIPTLHRAVPLEQFATCPLRRRS